MKRAFYRVAVTTHVVRLKLFRMKADAAGVLSCRSLLSEVGSAAKTEGVIKARIPYFGPRNLVLKCAFPQQSSAFSLST